jgi:hypothetical protein
MSEARAMRIEPFEVLIEAPNGHRTIRRVDAADEAAAAQAVQQELDSGVEVVGLARAGQGLGSGDQ